MPYIDLRKDLQKSVDAYHAGVLQMQLFHTVPYCSYVECCVIGAMISLEDRVILDETSCGILDAIDNKLVSCPKNQEEDIIELQQLHDSVLDIKENDWGTETEAMEVALELAVKEFDLFLCKMQTKYIKE